MILRVADVDCYKARGGKEEGGKVAVVNWILPYRGSQKMNLDIHDSLDEVSTKQNVLARLLVS